MVDKLRWTYLEKIVGTAECRLNGGARCSVEVASHRARGTVVAHFIQSLRLRGRKVTPGWDGKVYFYVATLYEIVVSHFK